MRFILDNTKAIPISGNRVYVCPICSRTFNTSQGYAGHFKAHRNGRREPYPDRRVSKKKTPSIAPYPLSIPRAHPMSAQGSMTNTGPGAGDDFFYAPNPLSMYNPFTNCYVTNINHVAEGYFHAERYVTKDFMGVKESYGSSKTTFNGNNVEAITKVGIEINSGKENVEAELDMELRL